MRCHSFCFLILTAEDPSENYVKLRDFVLVKLCLDLPSFSREKLPLGFSEEMAKEAREQRKINKVRFTILLKHRIFCFCEDEITCTKFRIETSVARTPALFLLKSWMYACRPPIKPDKVQSVIFDILLILLRIL